MKQPYNLLLCSSITKKPEDITCSVHMNSYGLMNEFSKLNHVTFDQCDGFDTFNKDGEWDFVLIHMYFDKPIFNYLSTLRKSVKHKIMLIMECPNRNPELDQEFVFNEVFYGWDKVTIIKNPIVSNLINLTSHIKKEPNSILIDHVWFGDKVSKDHSDMIYDWLSPLKDGRLISQLGRGVFEKQEHFPNWISKIPESNYITYLENTAKYENFILTHPGSYEHSVIDMASRGCRVIVPVMDGKSFCPKCVVESLNLPVFSTRDQLHNILSVSPPKDYDKSAFNDFSNIVAILDEYCQKNME